MRWLPILAALAVLAPSVPAQAASTMHTHRDWTAGSFEAGLAGTGKQVFPTDELAPDHERIPFDVDPCHRELSLGLTYEPRNASARIAHSGYAAEASLPYRFQAGLLAPNGTVMHRIVIDDPDDSIPFGVAEEPGRYTLELELLEGAMVDWDVRVRGFALNDEPTCGLWLNEVETNPGDGEQWVEIYHEGEDPVDLTGWAIEANRTGTEHALSATRLDPGQHQRVDVGVGAFAASEETVTLAGPTGAPLDRSVPLTDTAADEGTWQKRADGLGDWIFAPGTPGEPNAETR